VREKRDSGESSGRRKENAFPSKSFIGGVEKETRLPALLNPLFYSYPPVVLYDNSPYNPQPHPCLIHSGLLLPLYYHSDHCHICFLAVSYHLSSGSSALFKEF